jgi:hypothetical protein
MLLDLYEVSDHRKLPVAMKLAPVAMIQNLPNAIHVWEYTGKSRMFDISGDNYEWKGNMLTIYTEQGMINFIPLHPDSDVFAFISTPMDGLVQDCLR